MNRTLGFGGGWSCTWRRQPEATIAARTSMTAIGIRRLIRHIISGPRRRPRYESSPVHDGGTVKFMRSTRLPIVAACTTVVALGLFDAVLAGLPQGRGG